MIGMDLWGKIYILIKSYKEEDYIWITFFMNLNRNQFFLCVDDEKKLYLCLCSEIRYGQKWVITECELSTLRRIGSIITDCTR